MYKVTIALKDVGTRSNFADAFRLFWEEVMKMLKEGSSWQVLETACWIDNNGKVLHFYEARDLAYDLGVLRDGELQPRK